MASVLASQSPRRIALLSGLGITFDVEVADVDEASIAAGLAPEAAVVILAEAKVRRIRDRLGADDCRPIIGADTLVVLDGAPIGKPESPEQLAGWLAAFSGRSIDVVTGVAVAAGASIGAELATDLVRTDLVRTMVDFKTINPAEIERYVSSGVGDDKAGGLELQGAAAPFVAAVHGCWTNVIGLALCSVAKLLGPHGTELPGGAALCASWAGDPCVNLD